MRRSFSLVAAAVLAAASTAFSFVPSQAAPVVPPLVSQGDGDILQVQRWENFHGDRHSVFRDDGWNDNWRWRKRQQRRHARFDRRQFNSGFPFAVMPPFYMPYQPYRRHDQDCFRTWDGGIVCR